LVPGLFFGFVIDLNYKQNIPETDKRIWMIKQIFSSMGFSVIGRLAQFIGFVYASNCLLEEFGESSTALGWAQYIHFILTLGMDVVAVRYLADASKPVGDLIPSLFTGRLILFGSIALIGVLVCLFYFSDQPRLMSLCCGAFLNLFALGMNAQWVFQGKHDMPRYSVIQAIISILTVLCFYIFLTRQSVAGSDLWCMGIVQTAGIVYAWALAKKRYGVRLLNPNWIQPLGSFLKEGLGNWVFGLLYNTLITIGILSVVPLTNGNPNFIHHDDVFGNLYRFTLAIHFVLGFGGSVIYSKIVTWKHDIIVFRKNVLATIGWIILIGLFSSILLHIIHRPMYAWIFPAEVYQPAGPFVAWMVFGRFLALASGVLSWAMFSFRMDWMAVRCAFFPILLAVISHFWLVPLHGFKASVFLYVAGEMGLFLCSLVGFWFMLSQIRFQNNEKSV